MLPSSCEAHFHFLRASTTRIAPCFVDELCRPPLLQYILLLTVLGDHMQCTSRSAGPKELRLYAKVLQTHHLLIGEGRHSRRGESHGVSLASITPQLSHSAARTPQRCPQKCSV